MWFVLHPRSPDPPPGRYKGEIDHEVNFVQVANSKAEGFMACLDKKVSIALLRIFVFLEWFAKARGKYLLWQICVR